MTGRIENDAHDCNFRRLQERALHIRRRKAAPRPTFPLFSAYDRSRGKKRLATVLNADRCGALPQRQHSVRIADNPMSLGVANYFRNDDRSR